MLAGPRLDLRPLTAREARRFLAGDGLGGLVFADGYPSEFAVEVLRLMVLHPATDSPEDGRQEVGPWFVVRRSDRSVVGTVSCARTERAATLSVGYDIARSCRDRGYATEALGVVVAYLLSLPNVDQVCAETTIDHLASRRVLEKAGLGRLRVEECQHDGRLVMLVHYGTDQPPDPASH